MGDSSEDLEAWDAVAETYADQVGSTDDLIYERFEPLIWRHLGGDLMGLRVLDLGCGHGWLTSLVAARGAESVVGIDGSAALLGLARQHSPHLRFVQADLVEGIPPEVEDGGFDRVLAHMVVMDVPSLDAMGASLERCVRPGGRVVLTLLHPAFWSQSPIEDPDTGERYRKVRGYLEHEERWVTTFGGHRHYHRPLSFYVDWMVRHGFVLIELFEPPVPLAKPADEWTDYDRWFTTIPTMVGMGFVRGVDL